MLVTPVSCAAFAQSRSASNPEKSPALTLRKGGFKIRMFSALIIVRRKRRRGRMSRPLWVWPNR